MVDSLIKKTRIPSSFCGIYGFRPTPQRLTNLGLTNGMVPNFGQQVILPTAGPMARCVDDLALILKVWWVDKLFSKDFYVPKFPFNDNMYQFGERATTATATANAMKLEAAEMDCHSGSDSRKTSLDDERELSPMTEQSRSRSSSSSSSIGLVAPQLIAKPIESNNIHSFHQKLTTALNRTEHHPAGSSSLTPTTTPASFFTFSNPSSSSPSSSSSSSINATSPSTFKKLRIGYFNSNSLFPASAPNARAVTEAVEALQKLGHEVVPFTPPNMLEGALLYMGILNCDRGLNPLMKGLAGEQLHYLYVPHYFTSMLPRLARTALQFVLKHKGLPELSALVGATHPKSAYEFKQFAHNVKQYRMEYVKAWNDAGIDVLICPAGAVPAHPHDHSQKLTFAYTYFQTFNLLLFPAGTVPVTKVKPEEQTYNQSTNPHINALAQPTMENSAGLPVSVQVVAPPYEDELCLHVMRQIESEIGLHETVAL